MASYEPTSDSELRTMVRGLTLYENTSTELPQSDLDTQLKVAKLRVGNKAGSDAWYTDGGLGQALLGTTAIFAKAAVENYSVTSWDMGRGTIDVSGAGDIDQGQFSEWAEMVKEGMTASTNADSHQTVPEITNSFVQGR